MRDVDLLREAAAKMRQRAEAANTDDARRPWGNKLLSPVPEALWSEAVYGYLGGPIGEHCSALHPAVALAVADWLDQAVREYIHDEDTGVAWTDCPTAAAAVAVARAYLDGAR